MHRHIFRLMAVFSYLVFIICSGCSDGNTGDGSTLSIYYVTSSENVNAYDRKEALTPYPTSLSPESTTPEALISQLFTPPNDTLLSPFPSGTSLLSCTVQDGVAYVDLSTAYQTLSDYELTVANYAICLTLTQLPQIEALVITVDGQPLPNWEQQSLTSSDAVLSSTEKEYTSIEVALYFYDEKTAGLEAEYRTIFLEEETRLAKQIVSALISGPETDTLMALLPHDTELLDLTLEDGCCQITLSSAFWENVPDSQALQQLTIASVVNSLTNLEFVKSVQFLCPDPGMEPVYGNIELDRPVKPSAEPDT